VSGRIQTEKECHEKGEATVQYVFPTSVVYKRVRPLRRNRKIEVSSLGRASGRPASDVQKHTCQNETLLVIVLS
jgi:glycerate-2-kinase